MSCFGDQPWSDGVDDGFGMEETFSRSEDPSASRLSTAGVKLMRCGRFLILSFALCSAV